MTLGRREGQLMDQLAAATRAGDRDEVWRVALEFCKLEDEVAKA